MNLTFCPKTGILNLESFLNEIFYISITLKALRNLLQTKRLITPCVKQHDTYP